MNAFRYSAVSKRSAERFSTAAFPAVRSITRPAPPATSAMLLERREIAAFRRSTSSSMMATSERSCSVGTVDSPLVSSSITTLRRAAKASASRARYSAAPMLAKGMFSPLFREYVRRGRACPSRLSAVRTCAAPAPPPQSLRRSRNVLLSQSRRLREWILLKRRRPWKSS